MVMFIRKLFSATNVLVKGFQKLSSYTFTTRNADTLPKAHRALFKVYLPTCMLCTVQWHFLENLSLQTKPFLANSYNLF